MEEQIKDAEIEKISDEEKRTDLEKRAKEFGDELKELVKKYEVDLSCELQYLPQGIMGRVVLVDIKK